jgi:hypothetical protein
MIPIYIPTIGRDRVKILEQLEPHLHQHVTLVTNKAQQRSLSATYPKVVVVACPASREPGQPKADGLQFGIAPTRDWIIHTYCDSRYCMMLDDDVFFYRRKDMRNLKDWHARRATLPEVTDLLSKMNSLVKQYAFVGVSPKQGNNRLDTETSSAKRMWNVWGVDVKLLRRLRIRVNAVPVMEDFWVQLNLLTKGYETIQINTYMHCQNESGAAGGCSLFRTNAHQEIAVRKLVRHFPDFVTARVAKTKSGWFGGGERTDITFHGAKALKFGQEHGGLL